MKRDDRQNFLDKCGKIGLTHWSLPSAWIQASKQGRQGEQIIGAKEGPSLGDNNEGVRRNQARPLGGQRAHMSRRIVKRHFVDAPVVVVAQDLKVLPVQGMKRMGNREHPFRQGGKRCS
jgi:hypothetical protein